MQLAINIADVAQVLVSDLSSKKSDWDVLKEYKVSYKDIDMLQLQPRMDASCKIALLAAEKVLGDKRAMFEDNNIGIYVQTNCALMHSQYKMLNYIKEHDCGNKILFQHTANNLISGLISIKYHIHGYQTNIISNKKGDLSALALAGMHVTAGDIDVAIVVNVLESDCCISAETILINKNEKNRSVYLNYNFSDDKEKEYKEINAQTTYDNGYRMLVDRFCDSENNNNLSLWLNNKNVLERIEYEQRRCC